MAVGYEMRQLSCSHYYLVSELAVICCTSLLLCLSIPSNLTSAVGNSDNRLQKQWIGVCFEIFDEGIFDKKHMINNKECVMNG